MKKIFKICFTTFCFILFFLLKFNSNANSLKLCKTSLGVEYSMDDVVLYQEDFYNVNFTTEQEIYDYVYEVGFNRIETIDYIESYEKLTDAEKQLVLDYPLDALEAYNLAKMAKNKTIEFYPDCSNDGEIGNAFCHAYWVMMMYYLTSPEFAKKEAYAHENYPGNPTMQKIMDLYNDDVSYDFCFSYETLTLIEMQNHCKDLVSSGKLIYIINNYKYLSQIIYYEASGKEEYIYSTGSFHSYTNEAKPWGVITPKYDVVKKNPNGPSIL